MAYFEAHNEDESKVLCRNIFNTKPPYRVQVERIYPKSTLDANKFFNGVIVRAFMKHAGYTHFLAKAWISIYHACVKEIEMRSSEKPEIEELFDMFNVYLFQKGNLIWLNERYYSKMHKDFSGTMYVTQKTSQMGKKRRNEFVDEVIFWLEDQGVTLARNPDYKDELEF